MTYPQTINASASPEVQINDNFLATSWAGAYSKDATGDNTGLKRTYNGSQGWGGFSQAGLTHTFGASTTTYVSVAIVDGAMNFSTSNSNFNDTANYVRVETVITSGSAITGGADYRGGPGGLFGGGGAGGGGSLTNFTESVNTASPNTSIPVVRLIATNAATNVDIALSPKGAGAITAQIADSTTAGGNKRGANAVDLQTTRANANQAATGASSVVSGGSNNRASATGAGVPYGVGNTASGAHSGAGGQSNTASGDNSLALGGNTNTASGVRASCLNGQSNTASGAQATTIGGNGNVASGDESIATGKEATTRGLLGAEARCMGQFGNPGDAQRIEMILRRNSSNATPVRLTANNGSASSTNQMVLQDSSVLTVYGQVSSRDFSNNCSSWEFKASIKRGTGAASTAMVAACTPVLIAADAGASGWALTVTADTTLGCLAIEVAGASGVTTRSVCHITCSELKI